ncbi:MAG: phage holin family protein [Patescibacteria group bacterium]
MRMIIRPIFLFAANFVALLLLDYLITGFELAAEPANLIIITLVFTLLNSIIRPAVRYFLVTFLIFTFGLFSLIINAGVLVTLDFLLEGITINGLAPLIQSTVVMTAANVIIGFFGWILFRRDV